MQIVIDESAKKIHLLQTKILEAINTIGLSTYDYDKEAYSSGTRNIGLLIKTTVIKSYKVLWLIPVTHSVNVFKDIGTLRVHLDGRPDFAIVVSANRDYDDKYKTLFELIAMILDIDLETAKCEILHSYG